MAAITHTQIQARRDAVMRVASRAAVIVAKPDATDDATAGVFLVKDPDPGDAPNNTATQQGNAKGGAGSTTWKEHSYVSLGTAYGV